MADGAQDSSTTAAYFCHLGISFYISKLLPAPACPAAADSKTLFLLSSCVMQMHTPMDISWGVYRFECMNRIAFVAHMPSDSCTAISLFKVFWLLKSTFFLLN